ncbi:recombinase family protein [Deltaproteobacteria bacterium TL4]
METKIQLQHLQKTAYVYLRQSTMGQVIHNQESTERQYALREKASKLGWSERAIQILDQDLGVSGKETSNRVGFKTLVADVSMNRVGAIFVLEVSRLSRSCADWYRLLEICAITETLLIDEDGCYNPSDYNDQLILGLKGTMSQAELHLIRSRLLGGKLNKAKKGELRFPLPVGFCCNEKGETILDPDQEIQHLIRVIFDTFKQKRSAYGVVRYFFDQKLLFPKRAYGGVWKGKLIFGQLTLGRVLDVLKNPSYTGTYVYGRYGSEKKVSSEGKVQLISKKKSIEDWTVVLHNHHQGYISWDEYLEHQKMLEKNLTHGEGITLSGAAREGLALLQGLLICGHCGKRLSPRYQGNKGIYPVYECTRRNNDSNYKRGCTFLRADYLDKEVIRRVFELLKTDQIQLAVDAIDELQKRRRQIDKQWELKLQRAQYESDLAQRRYESVDPLNRLVASTLEKQWNETLIQLQEIQQRYVEHQQSDPLILSTTQKQGLLEIAKDFPKLWNAPSTESKDKKHILRLLIEDITVKRPEKLPKAIVSIRWKGGLCEEFSIELPKKRSEVVRYSEEIVDRVRKLAANQTNHEIAEFFNKQEKKSATGQEFTASMIRWIRHKSELPPVKRKQDDEYTLKEMTKMFGVSLYVVQYWLEKNIIQSRQEKKGTPHYVSLTLEKIKQLQDIVNNSSRINP